MLSVRDLRRELLRITEPAARARHVARSLAEYLLADAVVIHDRRLPSEITELSIPGSLAGTPVFRELEGALCAGEISSADTLVVSDVRRARLQPALDEELRRRGLRSFALIPLTRGGAVSGAVELHFNQIFHRFRRQDVQLLEHVADLLSWSLDERSDGAGAPQPQPAAPARGESDPLQSRRIQALYEMSRSLQIHLDPALVTLRGLRAMIHATHSDCGVAAFADPVTGNLEIVAAEGVSEEYVAGLSGALNERSLLKLAVESRRGVSIQNIQLDPRAVVDTARLEGLASSIIMPLMFEDLVLGAIAVFRRREEAFSPEDFELVQAGSSQICLVARQAEFYATERRNARSLAALYRLSHELSKHFTPKEVAEHAFPIIQEEIACKRMWLGVLNEQGTHIVGQAGFGPGLRRRIVEIQIERRLRHDFLDEAIEKKQPVIVKKGEKFECSGLNMILKRLDPGALILLPLVSLGQVVGVLIVEPEIASSFFAQSKLPLLSSMASEIATVILARRFESRMADADKMRMAGLLASGVAHNFNNLLQAVMGQASLIEMQLPKDSALVKSARMIIESAGRGASLISHLLACTVQESPTKSPVRIASMLQGSRDFYRSIIGASIGLEITPHGETLEIQGDYARIQQVMSNLLVRAKEAIGTREGGLIEIEAWPVRLDSGEIDSELAPGDYIKIEVRDNGLGMDMEQQTRCFEPFYTTRTREPADPGFSPTGLGLSSAYSVMKQHGGLITVSSEVGRGSVFTVYIPVHAVPTAIDESDPQRARSSEQLPDVIMFDLEDTVAASVASIVGSLGYRAVPTRRRAKALELVRASRDRLRLLIVDVDRSDDEALVFVRAVREEFPALRIVVSTFDHRRWTKLLRGVPHTELVQKPLSVWALDSFLKSLIAGKGTGALDRAVTSEVVSEQRGRRRAERRRAAREAARK